MPSSYSYSQEDFETAIQFAVNYFLDPTKIISGRTTGEPRGLGAILDAFTRGKLVEIGVQKIFLNAFPDKLLELDFNIKPIKQVKDEPDIISVKENDKKRIPKVFIEIKSTSEKDRWIGLTEEQLNTIQNAADKREIALIYTQISSEPAADKEINKKTADFVGMYLKAISPDSTIFTNFATPNAQSEIEFIITASELKQLGTKFSEGDLLFETDLFQEINKQTSVFRRGAGLRKGLCKSKKYSEYNGNILLPLTDGTVNERVGEFRITGSFEIYKKVNQKSVKHFIHCITETQLENDVFGKYTLGADSWSSFNLETVGRDPKLKRNNVWIAKRRIYQLLESRRLPKPEDEINRIGEKI